ncbi:MAG: hypothetical protein IT294_19170 [Deltaproteobacteria bacterium]|nr:hypothetical protein [Deltaproteobacteria bacterium]
MRRRLSRWLGVESGVGNFLLDPDDRKSRTGERLIVLIACCEALLLLSACAFGFWAYWRSG